MNNEILIRLQRIEEKLDNLAPCEEKQQAKQEAVQSVLRMLESSPIGKNPMIQEMLKPLMEMIK